MEFDDIFDMNDESTWRSRNLTDLEKNDWGEPTYDSHLVKTVHRLRYVPIAEFSIEDLRILIGQNVGLIYLLPVAIEELQKDLFAEGDFYPGDLLPSVLHIESEFWKEHENLWLQVFHLIKPQKQEIELKKIEIEKFLALSP